MGYNFCPDSAFYLFFYEVDCYDPRRDDWTTCPPLSRDKGSLAGVSVNGRIYAFGGGDGSECFSDVEIFDPSLGKWIKNRPMLERVLLSIVQLLKPLVEHAEIFLRQTTIEEIITIYSWKSVQVQFYSYTNNSFYLL